MSSEPTLHSLNTDSINNTALGSAQIHELAI